MLNVKKIDYETADGFGLTVTGRNRASLLFRFKRVKNFVKFLSNIYKTIGRYLEQLPSISPKIEGRAIATDAPSTILTQVLGVNYQFR